MKTINSLDDITLINQYIQGQTKLAFNQNLRIESISETIQLLTKKGFLLATINLANQSKFFIVRQNSNYWELLNQVLLENNFMPTGTSDNGLMRYEYYPIPLGYQMYYTEVRHLWKLWRSQVNLKQKNPAQLNLQIFSENSFQKIQEMAFSQESIYIKTCVNEILVENSDRVIWIGSAQAQPETTTAMSANTLSNDNNSLKASNIPSEDFLFLHQDHLQASEQLLSIPAITTENIVSFSQGKLYIQTTQGEIVVEGSNLKFRFNQPEVRNIIPQPLQVR